MKRTIFSLFLFLVLVSCKQVNNEKPTQTESNQEETKEDKLSKTLKPIDDNVLESAVIYEANIRQYSKEGTFNAFTKDIPVLKDLGVKILWLMPVYPISTTKSKGSLGSYYAISDYTKVNPEFGSLADLRQLIKVAHQHGIYVILDWVANHTGWDHTWIKSNPEYYTKDAAGQITHSEGTDWTDVADLNYDNMEMRNEMLEAMKYWVTNENIDGFRCDVAGMVPTDFWEHTIKELKKIKPLFMLAEWETPELLKNAFDMGYGWKTHHKMNAMAKGEANVTVWDQHTKKLDSLFEKDDILMNFTSNHDENSWHGTVEERLGESKELFAVLSYLIPGMPLIYSGQEYDMNKRLLFFEKDTIPKNRGKFFPLYQKLGKLKNEHLALHGGKNPASYRRIKTSTDDKILAFERQKENQSIRFIGNMTNEKVTFTIDKEKGVFYNYFDQQKFEFLPEKKYTLKPWEYFVLSKK